MGDLNFNNQFQKTYTFQGQVGVAANSLEMIIDLILNSNDIKPNLMLGQKIGQLEGIINNELVIRLGDFNSIWNVTKHGKVCMGLIDGVGFLKDGKIYSFNDQEQMKVLTDFTMLMKDLMKINAESQNS